jgi:hypothetical protein
LRIFILTDSLSLPRKHNDGEVLWHHIYPNLLKERFKEIEFIHVGIGGATIEELYNQLNYYNNLNPDIVILHCGIVDCAPRSLGKIELEIVKKLHIYRLVSPFFKLFRKYRRISYTTEKKFKNYLTLFKNRFPGAIFSSMGILPGCDAYDQIVPRVSQQIEKYNQILQKNTIHLSLNDIPRSGIISDFHHMNQEGHDFVYRKISAFIEKQSNID